MSNKNVEVKTSLRYIHTSQNNLHLGTDEMSSKSPLNDIYLHIVLAEMVLSLPTKMSFNIFIFRNTNKTA